MSKEFEEIVLKKIDKLDALETEVKCINQRLYNHEKELKTNQEEFKSIHNELRATQESIKNLMIILLYLILKSTEKSIPYLMLLQLTKPAYISYFKR